MIITKNSYIKYHYVKKKKIKYTRWKKNSMNKIKNKKKKENDEKKLSKIWSRPWGSLELVWPGPLAVTMTTNSIPKPCDVTASSICKVKPRSLFRSPNLVYYRNWNYEKQAHWASLPFIYLYNFSIFFFFSWTTNAFNSFSVSDTFNIIFLSLILK